MSLDTSLENSSQLIERLSKLDVLRFFEGLNLEETDKTLDRSASTKKENGL